MNVNKNMNVKINVKNDVNVNVNGLRLYGTFRTSGPQSALQHCLTFTHSHPDGGVSPAGRQPAGQEQSG